MQKVLLVDDRFFFRNLWMQGLRRHINFLHAATVEQGRDIFHAHADIAAIVVDVHMGGKLRSYVGQCPVLEWGLDTLELISEFRRTFPGPIIAAPSQPWHFKIMLDAGCSHWAWKMFVASLLQKLLLKETKLEVVRWPERKRKCWYSPRELEMAVDLVSRNW